jgi:hypothetical protein
MANALEKPTMNKSKKTARCFMSNHGASFECSSSTSSTKASMAIVMELEIYIGNAINNAIISNNNDSSMPTVKAVTT